MDDSTVLANKVSDNSSKDNLYKLLLVSFIVAAAYCGTALITIELLTILPSNAAAIWPAAGLALFSILKWKHYGAIGVFAGAGIFYLITYYFDGYQLSASKIYLIAGLLATGNLLQAILGCLLIKHYVGFPNTLIGERAIIKFLILGGPVSCLVASTWDVTNLLILKEIKSNDFFINWLTWWVGDSAGVIIFTPILLILFEGNKNIRRIRRVTIILPLIIILVIFYFFQYQNNKLELRRQKLEFEQTAVEIKRILDDKLNSYIEIIYSLKGLYDSSEYVSRDEFNTFTRPILDRYSEIQALEWIQRVNYKDRINFENKIIEEGYYDFEIKQRENDNIVSAKEQDEYFVVNYVEPYEQNIKAVGYDIKSNPEAKRASYHARDTGMPVATKPMRLIQETENQKGFVIYYPVYKDIVELVKIEDRQKHLSGFVAAAFRAEDMMRDLLTRVDKEDMTIFITDELASINDKIISGKPFENNLDKNTRNIAWTSEINVADRVWSIGFYPTDAYIAKHISNINIMFLLTNFFMFALLVAWLLSITGRNFRTEQIVMQRTRDLRYEIEERSRIEEQLSYHASHDMLTGLANRREFENRLKHVLKISKNSESHHVLCMMDLDRFKIINDTCGHVAGDELLRQVSKLLIERIRRTDLLARLGGDEFALLIQDCPTEEAFSICNDILRKIEELKFVWENKTFSIGISIGMVVIKKGVKNITDVLKEVDDACYMAKDGGRNRVYLHVDDDKTARRKGEIEWVNKINYALDNDQFCLMVQKIKSVKHKEDMYEVLIRMIDENGRKVTPGTFLPAAERYNLVEKIDHWVIKQAFKIIANQSEINNIPMLSINLSGNSISRPDFHSFVINEIKRLNIPANKICFEITETAAISNLVDAEEFIRNLRKQGCVFALDDFGSGFSSFAYLKNLPVDYLKIDGIFVKDILEDQIDYAMVRSINEIGHVMGKKTIAEFVESERIFDCLKEMGVDYVQGYGISMPQLIEKIYSAELIQ